MTTSLDPIVVGVSGSDTDDLAVAWAVDEAGSSNRSLRFVHAYQAPSIDGTGPVYTRVPAYFQGDDASARTIRENLVADMIDRARGIDPSVAATGDAIDGLAVPVLLHESTHASLVVLGSRQVGVLGSVLGSVSAAVAARAACSAIVLRGVAGVPEERPAVVVGIDGHDEQAAQTLLGFGFDYASRHGTPLRAVLCWHPDLLATMEWRMQAAPPEHVQPWLSEALGGWREKYPDVESHAAVISAHPTAGLVAESLNQRLLVVGNRGRHAFSGTLLGSVSQGVLHHAYCPVAVVPTHQN